jgi:hypothetical protein
MSLLLILGVDVVQKALAQLSGGYVVPVPLSFGCVAYSFNALISIFSKGQIMPATDCPSLVVNVENGYVRQNQSWILGCILRDFERPCKAA